MNYKEEALKMIEEGRVVFPLRDIDGNITGVIGKLLFKKDLSVPTYVKRGKGFCGNFETQRNEIIITESIRNVLIALAYKYDNFICADKDDFTDDVLKKLAKRNKKIILFLDNDELGQRNAKALRTKMEKYGIDVYTFQSTNGITDMSEYLRKVYNSIEDIIEVSNNIFYTGHFSIAGDRLPREHREENDYDDEVLPRLSERDKRVTKGIIDGYVTNIGTKITIHIKPEFNTEGNIERIKKDFGLTENNKRVSEIIVEEVDRIIL